MLVFKGPSFKRKTYIQAKIQSYNINEKKNRKTSTKLKDKNKWWYASMAFSFTLNAGKVLAVLQSLGSEFQIVAPLYAKLFMRCLYKAFRRDHYENKVVLTFSILSLPIFQPGMFFYKFLVFAFKFYIAVI